VSCFDFEGKGLFARVDELELLLARGADHHIALVQFLVRNLKVFLQLLPQSVAFLLKPLDQLGAGHLAYLVCICHHPFYFSISLGGEEFAFHLLFVLGLEFKFFESSFKLFEWSVLVFALLSDDQVFKSVVH
jgi:hypothetical protein